MHNNFRTLHTAVSFLIILFAFSNISAVILTGPHGSHDPSRMINCNGTYYIYSTGNDIPMMYSIDRINWKTGQTVFSSGIPSWYKTFVPNNDGHSVWAPDIIFHNNEYYLYYAISTPSGNGSAIGLATNPTLDPSAANYKWTDKGCVIHDNGSNSYNAIDPAPIVDDDGKMWMGFTIYKLIRLDPITGLRMVSDSATIDLSKGTSRVIYAEANYLYKHGGYYYLFVNTGTCCAGTSSTYALVMGRATTIKGPYLNHKGQDIAATANLHPDTLIATKNQQYGPGQMGICSEPGIDRFTYHYYPNASSVVGEQTLVWGKDNWPSAGKDLPAGTYQIASPATGLALGVTNTDASVGQAHYAGTSQQWKIALTSDTGGNDGYYSITSVGNGKAMEVTGCTSGSPTVINANTAANNDCQRWLIEQTSDGLYRISSRSSSNASVIQALDGSAASIGVWTGNKNQEWEITAPGSPVATLLPQPKTMSAYSWKISRTGIEFSFSSTGIRSLDILDLRGRPIHRESTNNRTIYWNSRGSNNQKVSAGTYVAHVHDVNGMDIQKRMVVE